MKTDQLRGEKELISHGNSLPYVPNADSTVQEWKLSLFFDV